MTKRRIAFQASVLALVFLLLTLPALGQITPTSRVQLDTVTESVDLAPHIYVTKDNERRLNYRVIVNRHQNNSRGVLQDHDIINLGAPNSPVWLVFSVINNTDNEEWILDFGSFSEGRTAITNKILVHNHTLGESFASALNQEGRKDTPPDGTRIPVRISNDTVNLFVIFLETEGGFPSLIAPRLEPGGAYMQNLDENTYFQFAENYSLMLFLIIMAGFFAALAALRRRLYYLFFSAYLIINFMLLNFINQLFYAENPLLNDVITLLVTISFIAHLLAIKWFLAIQKDDDNNDWRTLFIWGGIVVAAAVINIILWSSSNVFGSALFFILFIVSFAALFYLSIKQAQYGKLYAMPFAMGCGAFVIGGIISSAAAFGFITLTPLTIHAIWFALIPQNFLYAYASVRKFHLIEEEKLQKQVRESREAEAQARLKQSKESADQARLLRVIERERELMAELREREMQRTEEMRIAKEQADEANRAKSAFLAVVSHEIRTPMTGLMGMIRLLLDSKLNLQQHDYMLAMQKSGDTMMALLNDILDFEKIESGSMELESMPFDLPRLVQGVVTLMSAHAGEKGLTLKADIQDDVPQYVKGDPTRIRQVLLNLVNNALKFTEEGGVTIHLKAARVEDLPAEIKGDYEIYFSVSDTGIGISEEAQENLFAPFSQADSSISRKFGGTGLGLTICKRLVEGMGGAITLESHESEGSTFSFSLLMENAQGDTADDEISVTAKTIPSQENNTEVANIPSQHILIVDDNEMNRKVLEGFLTKMGHKIVQSDGAESALKQLQSENFDVVFMDINMTGMNGVEATRAIRQLPEPANETPVIALTGNVRDEDVHEYYAANLNGFIAKPIDPEKLVAVLKKVREDNLDNPVDTSPPLEPDQEIDEEEPSLKIDNIETVELSLEEEGKGQRRAPVISIPKEELLDWVMLESLYESIGLGQLSNLLEGFFEKGEEIIKALGNTLGKQDGAQMGERAHELKGMAANFGMRGVSDLSANVESSAHSGELGKASQLILNIPDVYEASKAEIENWLSTKD